MKLLKTLFFSICLLLLASSAFAQRIKIDPNQFDSLIYHHATLDTVDPVLVKAHCMKESRMAAGVNKIEKGYLTGRYKKNTMIAARAMRDSCNKIYGFSQDVETIFHQMAMSWDITQIMGIKAYEMGWRGLSFAGPNGLNNPDTALHYGVRLIKHNLKRYNGNVRQAISSYNAGSYTEKNKKYVNDVLLFMKRFENDFIKFEKCEE